MNMTSHFLSQQGSSTDSTTYSLYMYVYPLQLFMLKCSVRPIYGLNLHALMKFCGGGHTYIYGYMVGVYVHVFTFAGYGHM